jgi:hypothetical protein
VRRKAMKMEERAVNRRIPILNEREETIFQDKDVLEMKKNC